MQLILNVAVRTRFDDCSFREGKFGMGFNAQTGEYVNMMVEGMYDAK